MASKLFPVSRASRLLRQAPNSQYRSFSVAPKRLSDTLAVVGIPVTGLLGRWLAANSRSLRDIKGKSLTIPPIPAPKHSLQQSEHSLQVFRTEPQAYR